MRRFWKPGYLIVWTGITDDRECIMNLRNRSLIILGLIFFAIFIIIAVVSFSVTHTGLEKIEYADMNRATEQVQSSLNGESALLLSTAQDWGWWDETASFAADNNSRYIEETANPSSLGTIRVHLFMVLDPAGKPVFTRLLSPDFRQDEPVSQDLVHTVLDTPPLVHHAAVDPGTSGILLLPGGPMLIASTPILASNRTGPARGTLIMGRYVESGPLQRIEDTTGYAVRLPGQGGPGAAPALASLQERIRAGPPLLLVPDNESAITGYGIVPDLSGRNMVIGVTMQRDVYHAGLANIYAYLLLLLLWAVMTGAVVVIVMDLTVLRRIELLTDRVRALSQDHDLVPAPVLTGNDELAVLEQDIMESRAGLQMSERQLRVFINALPDPAALYARDGTILLANAALAAYLHRRPDELKGMLIRDLLPPEEMEKYRRQANEAIRKKVVIQSEVESGGKTLLISHYPVLDSDGEVIQIGLLTFDISERKRLENALQKVTKKIALLNTVIFSDIQNKIFVQRGYQELLRTEQSDPRLPEYLEKEEAAVKEIQSSLEFARQYSDMGMNPPQWQDVNKVMVYAISHLDLGTLRREFRLGGLEIYADMLLERVFFNLVQNIIRHARGATVIRSGYTITEGGAIIFIEDDGPGIPAEAKERIFGKGAGTGGAVGLFLSREILSITGISIRETGVPGQGARFEITVPPGSYRVTDT
jgi:PAS domain S-box-containing protein